MSSALDLGEVHKWDDATLRGVLDAVTDESRRRALDRCNPQALIEQGFAAGFSSKGMPADPLLAGGILVSHGAKVERSAMSHECGFVRVDSDWVWEHAGTFEDSVRHLPGPRASMRSVSLSSVSEGSGVDLVYARMRMGVHQLVAVRSFVVSGGELELVSARAVTPHDRRS